MKTNPRFSFVFLMVVVIAGALVFLSWSCKKDSDDNNNNNSEGTCWGENWLIGTWEGTTPSSVSPFANTKIRIVFEKAVLKVYDSAAGNPRRVWAYDGTLTWDVGGTGEWTMRYYSGNYPSPDYGVIIYECIQVNALKQGISNISIRVGDTTQTDPDHTVDLDWGPYTVKTSTPLTSFNVYGDVQLDFSGNIQRADYVPNESEITFTKK